jgi:hypothetical protein
MISRRGVIEALNAQIHLDMLPEQHTTLRKKSEVVSSSKEGEIRARDIGVERWAMRNLVVGLLIAESMGSRSPTRYQGSPR